MVKVVLLGLYLKEIFRQLKSAPINSLTHRLAICMCIVNHSLGGVRAVAHLWQEIVLEMRYRWDNVINVIECVCICCLLLYLHE